MRTRRTAERYWSASMIRGVRNAKFLVRVNPPISTKDPRPRPVRSTLHWIRCQSSSAMYTAPSNKGYSWVDRRSVVILMKKPSEWRKHCALAVVRRSEKFRPAEDPFPGAQDGQNLMSWRWSLPSPTDLVWWRATHAQFRVIVVRDRNTHPQTNKPTDRTDYNTLRCSQLARSVTITL